jgi:hypothetical protein
VLVERDTGLALLSRRSSSPRPRDLHGDVADRLLARLDRSRGARPQVTIVVQPTGLGSVMNRVAVRCDAADSHRLNNSRTVVVRVHAASPRTADVRRPASGAARRTWCSAAAVPSADARQGTSRRDPSGAALPRVLPQVQSERLHRGDAGRRPFHRVPAEAARGRSACGADRPAAGEQPAGYLCVGRHRSRGCRKGVRPMATTGRRDAEGVKRRGRDLNPRRSQRPETVFETSPG